MIKYNKICISVIIRYYAYGYNSQGKHSGKKETEFSEVRAESQVRGFPGREKKDSFDVYDSIFENARERLKTGGYFVMHLGKSDKCDMGEILQSKALRYFRKAKLYSEDVSACEKFGIVDLGSVSEHQYLVIE